MFPQPHNLIPAGEIWYGLSRTMAILVDTVAGRCALVYASIGQLSPTQLRESDRHQSRPWSGRRALLLDHKVRPNGIIAKSVYPSVFEVIEVDNHKVIARLLPQPFIKLTKSLQFLLNRVSDCGIAITRRSPWRIRLQYVGPEELQWQPVIIWHSPTISKSFSKGP